MTNPGGFKVRILIAGFLALSLVTALHLFRQEAPSLPPAPNLSPTGLAAGGVGVQSGGPNQRATRPDSRTNISFVRGLGGSGSIFGRDWRNATNKTEGRFVRFTDWTDRYFHSEIAARQDLEKEGIVLARARREQMEDLIPANPRRALELSVPREIRSQLPSAVQELLEEPVSARGSLMVRAALPAPGEEANIPWVERFAEIGDSTFKAYVYGRRDGDISRQNIPLHGIMLGGSMAVDENPVRILSQEESKAAAAVDPVCAIDPSAAVTGVDGGLYADVGGEIQYVCGTTHAGALNDRLVEAESGPFQKSTTGETAESAYTEGLKSVILIRLDFSDLAGVPFSDTQANNLVNGLHTFYSEGSFQKTGFKKIGDGSDVTPTLRMPQTTVWYGTNDASRLRSDARTAARAAGYDLSRYNFDVIWFGKVPGFKWSGLGYVGSPGAWVQDTSSVGVTAHELGHNFGLNHANFWETSGQSVIGTGTSVEYGDKYDTMGSANAGAKHFNARYKSLLNWIPTADVLSPTNSGTFRIFPHDDPAATGPRAIRLVRSSTTNYWIEFRQRYSGNKWMADGVTLRWAGTGSQSTRLLDMTPGTIAGKDDAALLIGRTFSDRSVPIHITPIGKGGTSPESVDVVINRGNDPNNVPPSVSMSAPVTAAAVNVDLNFTAVASDPNGDRLAYFWDFGDGSYEGNSRVVKHRWSSAGEFIVRCEVSDMKGGVSSARVLVRIGNPSTFRISGRVMTTDGLGVQGVRISASSTLMTWSDANGNYDLTGLPAGTFTLKATLDGYLFSASGFVNPVSVSPSRQNINFEAAPPSGLNTTPLVAAGSLWSYRDNGNDLGSVWREMDFNSASWKEGPAPLGYGDDNEKTVISYGSNSSSKYVTYYFRKKFVVLDSRQISSLTLGLRRDDGGVVYLNGREVFRSNMPSGTILNSTLASTSVGGDDEAALFTKELDPSLLLTGANVLAVEIHQNSRSSSDVVFDLELLASIPQQSAVPVLIAERSGSSLSLSWPETTRPWFLYSNLDLEGESFWTPVLLPLTVSGNRRIVNLPLTDERRFFRLSDQSPDYPQSILEKK